MRRFLKFSSFDRNIQRPIKWREEIVRQVLKSSCKLETSVFKLMAGSVTEKILSRFYARLNFYNFLEEKTSSITTM